MGRNIHTFTIQSEACVAVRERRQILARLLDVTVERVGQPDILTLACGHLREADWMMRSNEVGRWIVVDQDDVTIQEVARSNSRLRGLIPVKASAGRFIVRPTLHGHFDLIYAAGLYDYLDNNTAKRLAVACFSALKRGGYLLIANFSTGLREAGYMDAFMDWQLCYRTEADIQDILNAIPNQERGRETIFRGANGAIIYGLVQRTK